MAKLTMWERVKALTARDVPAPIAVFFPALPPEQRECPACHEIVTCWRTYANGLIRCVNCPEPEQRP